jgi:hypothetical protein
MYSIVFKQPVEPSFTHDDLKRVINKVIEQWADEGDKSASNATPEAYKNPWNYVDLNRRLISGRLLDYNSRVVNDDFMIEFNLNEVLDSSSKIKADYWEDKYLQNYNDVEKLFHPLIDGFFNNFDGVFTFIVFKEMSASQNFKEIPTLQHKLFNQ